MRGTVEEEPDVDTIKALAIVLQVLAEVWRPSFLFAIEEEDEVRAGRHPALPESPKHWQERGNGRLVITGRSRVDPALWIDSSSVAWKWPGLAADLPRRRVERRLERRMRPLRRIDGLAVVVHVDAERARGARHDQLAIDDGRRPINTEQLGAHPDTLKLVADVGRGALDVLGVLRAIGIREERDEVAEDRRLMLLPVCARDIDAALGRGHRGEQESCK